MGATGGRAGPGAADGAYFDGALRSKSSVQEERSFRRERDGLSSGAEAGGGSERRRHHCEQLDRHFKHMRALGVRLACLPVMWWWTRPAARAFYHTGGSARGARSAAAPLFPGAAHDWFPELERGRHPRPWTWRYALEDLHVGGRALAGAQTHAANEVMLCPRECVCVYVYVFMYVWVDVCIHVCVCVCVYTNTHTHACMHAYIHTLYVCKYIYTGVSSLGFGDQGLGFGVLSLEFS